MSLASIFYANENNIIALIIIALILTFVIINRKKFDVEGKVVFIYRTKIGLGIMKKLSVYKRFFNIYGILAVVAGIGSVATFLYLIFVYYFKIVLVSPSTSIPAASFVLPFTGIPYVIGVPVFYWLIALIVVVIFHEASHGIISLSKKVKVKHSGFGFFLGFLPLAFVEPDEKRFEKIKRFDRLKVLAAGSFTNLIMGIVALVLVVYLSSYIVSGGFVSYAPIYLNVVGIQPGSPANLSGLQAGTTIVKIDNISFTNAANFNSFILGIKPNQTITMLSSNGSTYTLVTTYNSSIKNEYHGYIGVLVQAYYSNYQQTFGLLGIGLPPNAFPTSNLASQSIVWVDGLLVWLSIIALGLGLANFLPIFYITDGCKMFYEFMGYVFKDKKTRLKATNAIIIAFSALFIFLLIPPSLFL